MKEKIQILGTSDLHGYLYPYTYADNSQSNIGLAKISTLISKYKESKDNIILLDNGDTIQGSPLTYYHYNFEQSSSHFMSDVFNTIKYDAVNIGNHEFNYGQEYLKSYTENLNAPVLCSNILKDNKPMFNDYIIKETAQGVKIAITGVVTHYIPHWEQSKNIRGLKFMNAFDTLKKTVEHIRDNEEIDFLIAMYHGGFEKDLISGIDTEKNTGENQGYKMLQEIKGIDYLMTGHQHRSLSFNNINGISVTQPGCNGFEMTSLEVEFEFKNDKWLITNKEASLINTRGIEADQKVLDLNQMLENNLQDWLDIPIGSLSEGNLIINDMFDARLNKHKIVKFINDVQLDVSGADIACNSLANQVRGFNNKIAYRDIISTYIYPNTLAVLEIDGKSLIEVLNQNANYFVLEDNEIKVRKKFYIPKEQHYNYDIYDGINYDIIVGFDSSHVENVTHNDKLIEDDDVFTIVLNNYRAAGGGDFAIFPKLKIIKEIQIDMVEIIADYIKKRTPIKVEEVKNINVIKKS